MTIMAYCVSQIQEAQVLSQYGKGDETAFGELVDMYKSCLRGFLRRFLNCPELVEDVFQETLLQLYASRGSFDVSRPLRPWLLTIAANKAKDALRRAKRHRSTPVSGLTTGENLSFDKILNTYVSCDDDPSLRLDRSETAAQIRQVVGSLPEKQCEILTLAYFDQLAYKQIAAVLRIPIGTVKSRLHTAVDMFARAWAGFQACRTVSCSADDMCPVPVPHT
ncbi:MAG: RNA polymerase sigma factor [Phycisphaerae bacterium]|nr:RNA polymerase sigma factor [Phycisphaerae bacterium]